MVSLKKLPIVSDVKVSYHPKMKISEMPVAKNSQEVYQLFLAKWDRGSIHLVEEFKIMLFTRGGSVKGIYPISKGGITGTVADPEIILLTAIVGVAKSIVLCHNHPSGSLIPSHADLELTEKIKNGSKFFDIKVLDHLIISSDGFLSFADEGLL